MSMVIEAEAPTLTKWDDGSIRIAKSRVTLETIIITYKMGQTAEEIHYGFPTLALADIHAAIAYYLRHRDEVEKYLKEVEEKGERLRKEIEAKYPTTDLREKLLA